MKKFAIGCLVVFVLVVGIGGFFAYRYVIKPSMDVYQGVQQLTDLNELNDSILNQNIFNIPTNNELTETQVADYVGILRFMREDLRDEYETLKTEFTSLDNISGNIFGNIQNITAMSQDLIGTVKEAKLSEIKAINEANYSFEEYTWVRERVLEAAGLGASSFGIDQLTQLAEQAGIEQAGIEQGSSQTLQNLEDEMQSNLDVANVPQKNIDLVQPYVEELSAILNFINFDFSNLNLESLNLENLNLDKLNLENLDLGNLNLENLNPENLNLDNLNLENLDLGNLNLNDLNPENLNLENLNLGNLNLNDLNLENLNLENLNLNDLNLEELLNQPNQ